LRHPFFGHGDGNSITQIPKDKEMNNKSDSERQFRHISEIRCGYLGKWREAKKHKREYGDTDINQHTEAQ